MADLPINYTLPGTIDDGNYSLNFTITDPVGNVQINNVGTTVVDATAPSIFIITQRQQKEI